MVDLPIAQVITDVPKQQTWLPWSLLKSKATEEEVKGYVDWSISLAEKVASAAKEGGFLGIGGERVSEEERRAIHAVRDALSG